MGQDGRGVVKGKSRVEIERHIITDILLRYLRGGHQSACEKTSIIHPSNMDPTVTQNPVRPASPPRRDVLRLKTGQVAQGLPPKNEPRVPRERMYSA